MTTPTLSPTEIERYERQLILPNWSIKQQLRLKETTVAVSAGLPTTLLYLASAGVGSLLIVSDIQLLGQATKLKHHVAQLNPDISCEVAQLNSPQFAQLNGSCNYVVGEPAVSIELLRSLLKGNDSLSFQLMPNGRLRACQPGGETTQSWELCVNGADGSAAAANLSTGIPGAALALALLDRAIFATNCEKYP